MDNLDFPQAVEEIKQAATWLREQGAPKVPLTSALVFCNCAIQCNTVQYSAIQSSAMSHALTPHYKLSHTSVLSLHFKPHPQHADP